MFLVPRLDKTCTAPSSYGTIEKAKKKLNELEQQHGNKLWSELLKEELVKAQSEITAEVNMTSQSDDKFHDCMSDNVMKMEQWGKYNVTKLWFMSCSIPHQ